MNRLVLLVALLPAMGCLDLDGFVHNPIHCSTVGPDTCGEESGKSIWDEVCVPCEEEYDWAKAYDWIDGTIDAQVPSVRAPETVTRHTMTTSDGAAELDVYDLASHGEVPELANVVMLYQHGRYAGIEHYQPRIRFLHEAGYRVIAWDYRGYGKSTEGAPNVDQFLGDAHEFLDFVETELDVNLDNAVAYANSLGGIPAVEMATSERTCALIMEAGFTAMSSVSEANSTVSFSESFFSQNRFDNRRKLAEDYNEPLLVMTGSEDNFFRLEEQEALFEAANEPKEMWVVEGAAHGISNGGIPEAGLGPYFDRMRAFLEDTAPDCLQ